MPAYRKLVTELRDIINRLDGDTQYWIGVAGAPGSGKSTLAAALKEQLGEWLTVIPLDGYHYYRSELDKMENPVEAHIRRGAPFTFNATRFVEALIKARKEGEGSFPGFDHGVGDPVENAIQLHKGPQIVLVEGNYLLLDQEPWSRLQNDVFDQTWFLDVPIPECNRRVYERHLANGLSEAAALQRVETNDNLNAALIAAVSPARAGRIVSGF